jgi:8-amino-7-oxononanoate synthase
MADDLDSSRSRVTGEEVLHETPWLQFKKLTYQDPTGRCACVTLYNTL